MSKFLAGIAALTLAGAAMMPIQASATEAQSGAKATTTKAVQSTDISAQRHYYRHGYYPRRHWGPRYGYYPRRHYWGPRYGYYRPYRPYGYYGYPYYRPGPAISFGVGPFGFGVF